MHHNVDLICPFFVSIFLVSGTDLIELCEIYVPLRQLIVGRMFDDVVSILCF